MHPLLALHLLSTRLIPPWYDATLDPNTTRCRIFHTALFQGHCNACAAFSVSTAWSMRLCLRHGIDFIPSPYRMYDCFATSCENGSSISQMARLLSRADANNITDISASPRRYGLACPSKEDLNRGSMVRKLVNTVDIKQAIMQWGPLPAAVDFNDAERYYWLGVLHPPTAPKPIHSVVVVGWGSEPEHYWLIQNSWGRHWGNNGRGLLAERSLKYAAVEMDQSYLIHFLALWIFIPLFTVAIIIVRRRGEDDDYE